MAASYPYLGFADRGYPDYLDEVTGLMLVAQPGGAYSMRAVDGEREVPPPDGCWGEPGEVPHAAEVKLDDQGEENADG